MLQSLYLNGSRRLGLAMDLEESWLIFGVRVLRILEIVVQVLVGYAQSLEEEPFCAGHRGEGENARQDEGEAYPRPRHGSDKARQNEDP